ncbi:MAG TPA: hypothetical protein VH764_01245 [Gemmatimonadales bacterium]|jgi:hypothetical protein
MPCRLLGLLAAIVAGQGCVPAPGQAPSQPTPVWIRSHNRSAVDVYLLCGTADAQWLGAIPHHSSDAFEISARQRECAPGLQFFLVVRDVEKGYWVGPLRPQHGDAVHLVIEKYAALSNAYLRYGWQ